MLFSCDFEKRPRTTRFHSVETHVWTRNSIHSISIRFSLSLFLSSSPRRVKSSRGLPSGYLFQSIPQCFFSSYSVHPFYLFLCLFFSFPGRNRSQNERDERDVSLIESTSLSSLSSIEWPAMVWLGFHHYRVKFVRVGSLLILTHAQVHLIWILSQPGIRPYLSVAHFLSLQLTWEWLCTDQVLRI